MEFISKPMGWLLAQLSNLVGNNFAASVVIFTILVNLIMLPLTIKSQKSTAKQAKLKPKLDALKKKYGNDKQKYSQAMSELYTKEGVSMSGGCLPMIVRLVIMFGVYYAVISPLTYVQGINAEAINAAKLQTQYVKTAESTSVDWSEYDLEEVMADEDVIARAAENGSEDIEFYAKLQIVEDNYDDSDEIKKAVDGNAITQEIDLVSYLTDKKEHHATIVSVYTENDGSIDDLDKINFGLFGLDLTETPVFDIDIFANFRPIWLIPLSSFAVAMLTSIISMIMQKKANPDAPSMALMMLIMPVFSLFIAFKVPGAVGFYWTCSNIVASGLQYATQAFYGPNAMIAREQSANIVKRAKLEQAKIEKVSNKVDTEN